MSKERSPAQPSEKSYGFEYSYFGKQWLINIPASSEQDARDRLYRASVQGRCVGTLEATIPAVPGAGLLTRFICWWRNL